MLAVTAVSASLPGSEREACAALAEGWGMPWQEVVTDELANPDYARNDGDRCYWCKEALLEAIGPIAEAAGATVVLGVNLDDLGDHRPGQRSAVERGARFPLVEAGFSKADVRAWSKELGLLHVGQAGGRLPGVAPAVRHRRHAGPAQLRRARRGRASGPRLHRPAGASPRRGGPHRGSRARPRCRPRQAHRGAGRRASRRVPVGDARPGRSALRWLQSDAHVGGSNGRLPPVDGPRDQVGGGCARGADPPWGTTVHVGNVRWATSRCSTMRPLAASSSTHGPAVSRPPAIAT